MKLQFAFGNPRRAKGKKKHMKGKKKIAKKGKKSKTIGSKNLQARLKRAVQMARRKHRKAGKRKNPALQMAYKMKDGKKKLVGTAKFLLKNEYEKLINNSPEVKKLTENLVSAPFEQRKRLRMRIIEAKRRLASKYIADVVAKQKFMQRLAEEGAEIKTFITKEGSVARKRKKKAGKKAAKATKKASSKKKAKGGKKARSKAQKAALRRMIAANKAKKKKGRKAKKHRKYPKMIVHKHSTSMRHIPKGATTKVSVRKKKGSYKISAKFGRGKKKVRMTGRLRQKKSGILSGNFIINPFGRNPMNAAKLREFGKNMAGSTKQEDLVGIGLGVIAVPYINKLFPMIPGSSTLVGAINRYAGPEAGAAAPTLLAGAIINGLQPSNKYAKGLGNGLFVVGLVTLASSLVKSYMPGLSGVNYTPTMRGMGIMPTLNGVNYTPNMRGINYTPDMRGMGIMPQLAGADFGAADYGGGGGSREAVTQRSDFGAWQAQDSEAEADDNSYSSSMN